MEAASSYSLPPLISLSKAVQLLKTRATYAASLTLLSSLFSETLPNASDLLARALEIAQDFAENVATSPGCK